MRKLAIVLGLTSALLATTPPWTVSAVGCDTGAFRGFTGTILGGPAGLDGATADIEFVDEQLCSGTAATASSYWVALGNIDDPFNIFQVGVDKCRGPGCPQTNEAFYFWAYGWDESTLCGGEHPPVALFIADYTGSGSDLFTVIRNTATTPDRLESRINGGMIRQQAWQTFEDCWDGGVTHIAYRNEVVNKGTQIGGPNANRQNWESVRYHEGSWKYFVNPSCSAVPATWTHAKCAYDPSTVGKFWSWDTRY